MADADVVMVYRVLDHLGLANKHIVLEFKRIRNMSLLDPDAGDSEDMNDPERTNDEKWFHDPRYVSGMIFTPQVLGSLLGNSYRALGLFEIMQRFLMVEGGDLGVNFLWQMRPRASYCNKRYGEVFQLLVEEGALPLGLLRVGLPIPGEIAATAPVTHSEEAQPAEG